MVTGKAGDETALAQPASDSVSTPAIGSSATCPSFGQSTSGSPVSCVCIGYDSAWTADSVGAVSAISEDPADCRQFYTPVPLRFEGATEAISSFMPAATLRVLAIDQPTIVPNTAGSRPVERAVAGVVNSMRGGVQPANRGKIGMFDDAAPIWKLIRELGYPQSPHANRPMSGSYLLEVYPCLNLLGLVPRFLTRGECAKYNPTLATFRIEDWRSVCLLLSGYGARHRIAGLDDWARKRAELVSPRKPDQDQVDAALSAVVAFEWAHRGLTSPAGVVVGDTATGYMFTPASDALAELLSAAARRRSVPIARLW